MFLFLMLVLWLCIMVRRDECPVVHGLSLDRLGGGNGPADGTRCPGGDGRRYAGIIVLGEWRAAAHMPTWVESVSGGVSVRLLWTPLSYAGLCLRLPQDLGPAKWKASVHNSAAPAPGQMTRK